MEVERDDSPGSPVTSLHPPCEKRARLSVSGGATPVVAAPAHAAAAAPAAASAGLPRDLDYLLCRASPFPNEAGELPNTEFVPGALRGGGASTSPGAPAAVRAARVLVVGAGGLGCEVLHSLALAGFTDVHVIDADTVDLVRPPMRARARAAAAEAALLLRRSQAGSCRCRPLTPRSPRRRT